MQSKCNNVRQRSCTKTRAHIASLSRSYRLSVFKTPRHITATVSDRCGAKIIVCISSQSKVFREQDFGKGKLNIAAAVGKEIACRVLEKGIDKNDISFDRSGYKYHGRIKKLADGAREAGLEF